MPLPALDLFFALACAQAPMAMNDGRDCCASTRPPLPDLATADRKSRMLIELADQIDKSGIQFLGRRLIALREKQLMELPKNAPPGATFQARLNLADALVGEGNTTRAIDELQRAHDLGIAARDQKMVLTALRRLGLTWMRVGERSNCQNNHNADSCLLPIRGGGVHVDRKGSYEAIRVFERILGMDGRDTATMWLLNVAHMTLGTWPEGVQKQWRLPSNAFDSEFQLPRMPDVAAELGLHDFTRAGGSCMDDFDGDGLLDIVTSSMDHREPLRMQRQQPDGTFKDVTAEVGLAAQLGGLNFHAFDANNDGRLDLIVPRGAWLAVDGQFPNSLLIQQPDGTFVDRTKEAGIELAIPSQVAVSADIDVDGDLDLFFGGEGMEGSRTDAFYSHLFRNNGDGTFEDITKLAGVQNGRFCKGATFGDYDGDGLPDLYVGNMSGWNRLFHNEGGGKFKDVTDEQNVGAPLDSFGSWFFDYDNDGDLDLFATCYHSQDRSETIFAYYMNGSTGFDTMRLYRNDGGNFTDATREVGLKRVVHPMGCNYGDIDEDGFQDIYLATGDPDFASLWPNVMLRNDGGKRFQDVTTATGTGHLQKGHGVSFGDYDNDGDQDLFVQMGGAFADDAFADAFYKNPGHGHHGVTVRLVGRRSNRFGVGARITATVEEEGATRNIVAFVGMNSSFGGNSLQAEMGLRNATRIATLEVVWPGGVTKQSFTDVPLDATVTIDEEAGLTVKLRP